MASSVGWDATLPARLDELRAHGVVVIPNVLTPSEALRVRAALQGAAIESERRGVPTFIPVLDPNDANVRVFNLLDLDGLFRDLIMHPLALALARGLLGDNI